MPKPQYLLAVICYLAIPAVVIGGAGVFHLIDPEMARGHANYARDYRMLDLARLGVLWASGALALVLWTSCCYPVLKSRQRSTRWPYLASAGPLGFSVIAALKDRSSVPGDLYQHVIRNLKAYWRVPLEMSVFVTVWVVAYEAVVLERELMIRYESLTTGTPVPTIIAQQSASSGMWAAGEGMEQLYLVPLFHLLWPILFNLGGQLFKSSSGCSRKSSKPA